MNDWRYGSLLCIGIAGVLAFQGSDGWGWFLLIGWVLWQE